MTQLKLVSTEGTGLGVINWYAVHGTSMNSSNCLVTSDNVGYASVLFEKHMNNGSAPGKVSDEKLARFLALFALELREIKFHLKNASLCALN